MSDGRTGRVSSRRGKIKAEGINTGLAIDGAIDQAVITAALACLSHLQTGDVEAARGIETAGTINVGVHYSNQPNRASSDLTAALESLRSTLVGGTDDASRPEAFAQAVVTVDQILDGVAGLADVDAAPLVRDRLRQLIVLLTRTGDTVYKAGETAGSIGTALNAALELYKSAHTVF